MNTFRDDDKKSYFNDPIPPERLVTLKLDVEVALWLKAIVRNPINCPQENHEDPVDIINRRIVFEQLKDVNSP